MVIGDVMSHALEYIEIGNSLSFPLEVVYMGSGTHIKSVKVITKLPNSEQSYKGKVKTKQIVIIQF